MTERLKQIWGGFEAATTRHLTGRGIENIDVPTRRDFGQDELTAPTAGEAAPAAAAFAALRARLADKSLKGSKRRAGEPAPPAPAFSPGAETDAARDLIRGLRATEMRVVRPLYDYADSLSGVAQRKLTAAAKKSQRKKFLGIF